MIPRWRRPAGDICTYLFDESDAIFLLYWVTFIMGSIIEPNRKVCEVMLATVERAKEYRAVIPLISSIFSNRPFSIALGALNPPSIVRRMVKWASSLSTVTFTNNSTTPNLISSLIGPIWMLCDISIVGVISFRTSSEMKSLCTSNSDIRAPII